MTKCKQCRFWEREWRNIGQCSNIRSDHYRHNIVKSHPACKNIEVFVPKKENPNE
jgi:hypothetical protein